MPQPTPEAKFKFEEQQAAETSARVASQNIAKSVWLLAEFSGRVDAAQHAVDTWRPEMDVYPQPTTAARLRQAADYLNALAEVWPQ